MEHFQTEYIKFDLVDTASTTWLLVASAFVWIMIPGIGLFYSGMTKRKNGLSLLWLSFMAMAVTSIQVCIASVERLTILLVGFFRVSVVFSGLFIEFQHHWIPIRR